MKPEENGEKGIQQLVFFIVHSRQVFSVMHAKNSMDKFLHEVICQEVFVHNFFSISAGYAQNYPHYPQAWRVKVFLHTPYNLKKACLQGGRFCCIIPRFGPFGESNIPFDF